MLSGFRSGWVDYYTHMCLQPCSGSRLPKCFVDQATYQPVLRFTGLPCSSAYYVP